MCVRACVCVCVWCACVRTCVCVCVRACRACVRVCVWCVRVCCGDDLRASGVVYSPRARHAMTY